MRTMKMSFAALAIMLPLVLLVTSGCGDSAKNEKAKVDATQVAQNKGHDHSGWWCDEHGIPEDDCSMCSSKVAAAYKKKGDWCDKHDRAMSQCFICKPERKEFYAAKYRAKYDKEPPPIEDDDKKESEQK